MKITKFALTAVLVSSIGASAVAAQDAPFFPRGGGAVDAALDAAAVETGLEASEIVSLLREGQSLADIVTENGGDPQAVIDAAVEAATAQINAATENGRITEERANEMLSALEDAITSAVNGEFQPGMGGFGGRGLGRSGRGGRGMDGFGGRGAFGPIDRLGNAGLVNAIVESTDLELSDIRDQMQDGVTLGEIITNAGADPAAVVEAALANAQERVNEAVANGQMSQELADALLSDLETQFNEALNSNLWEQHAGGLATVGVLRLAAEETGLDEREIAEELRGGATLADILTENGVDVNAFISDAVARADARLNVLVVEGRITEARKAELLASFEAKLTERLNAATADV